MSKGMIIARREFMQFARSRLFLITTLFGPLMILVFMVLPRVLSGGGTTRHIVVVDETDGELGAAVQRLLAASPARAAAAAGDRRGDDTAAAGPGGADEAPVISVDRVLTPTEEGANALLDSLRESLRAKQIDGILWLPPNTLEADSVRYEGRSATNSRRMAVLRSALNAAVQQQRLRALTIPPGQLRALLRPVAIEARRPAVEGERGGSAESAFFVGQGIGFALYMAVLLYGQAVLRSVLEEKRDRIVEVLLSSVRARDVLVGKVTGVGLAGLLQMVVWAAFAVLALTHGGELFGASLPAGPLPGLSAKVGIAFIVFFLGGYFLYASLSGAMGSLAGSDQDAQQLMMPVIILLVASFFMMFATISEPDGRLARFASIFPISSPLVMPVRLAVTRVPPLQYAGALAALLAGCVFTLWLSAKIYRIGILSTGKRPSAAELWRWLRTA